MRRAFTIATMLAALAAGCGSATGAGTTAPAADAPISHDVPPGSRPPATGSGATLVTPRAGDGDSWPVRAAGLRVGVGDDGVAWARASWWGGIPSCYVLRPVTIDRSGHTIRLRLREGSDASPGTVCADIAMLKAVRIDLGVLPAGTYQVRAGGRRATLRV
jgi:hypothetical protein